MKISAYSLVVVSVFLLVALVIQGLVPYQAKGIEQKEPKRAVIDRHETIISQQEKVIVQLKIEVADAHTSVRKLNIRLRKLEDTVRRLWKDAASLKGKERKNNPKD